MATQPTYHTPAYQAQIDFKGRSEQDLETFQALWNDNVLGWTEMGIIGNPWSNQYDAPRDWYFNPAQTGWPSTAAIPIEWTPFPNRLLSFYNQPGTQHSPQLDGPLTVEQIHELADTAQITVNGKTYKLYDPASGAKDILKMPATKCPQIDWTGDWVDFSPFGPRGWLDEYCEWSITWDNDTPGTKIKSVMFTCENPAYWLTLWRHDPKLVLELYQKNIDPAVKLDDLYLTYPEGSKNPGKPVPDPTTGHNAYDPTNIWNRGTLKLAGKSGGAMHLTSAPNTLSAEIYLASASTIQRKSVDGTDPQGLICCSQYGQNFRNSDPHIGATGNRAAEKVLISLTDPVGLYIQTPNWSRYQTPDKTPASDFWTITRGKTDPSGTPGMDSILHAVFEVPESKGYTVSDITIDGQDIQWAGQIADTFQIALRVTPQNPTSSTPPNTKLDCVIPQTDSAMQPWPVQLLPQTLFEGGSPTDLPALLIQGKTNTFVLVVQGATDDTTTKNARIEFERSGITGKVTEYIPDASSIPGQTDGGGTQAYVIDISVDSSADTGPVGIRALNPSEKNPTSNEHPYEQGLGLVVSS